jgi:hypothetical protein
MIQRADRTWDIINRIISCVNITGGWPHPLNSELPLDFSGALLFALSAKGGCFGFAVFRALLLSNFVRSASGRLFCLAFSGTGTPACAPLLAHSPPIPIQNSQSVLFVPLACPEERRASGRRLGFSPPAPESVIPSAVEGSAFAFNLKFPISNFKFSFRRFFDSDNNSNPYHPSQRRRRVGVGVL